MSAALAIGIAASACSMAAGPVGEADHMADARQLARSGDQLLAEGKAEAAARLFDQALATIADSYLHPGTIDDTGTKLVLANAEAAKGHFEVAANLKAAVVRSRLARVAP